MSTLTLNTHVSIYGYDNCCNSKTFHLKLHKNIIHRFKSSGAFFETPTSTRTKRIAIEDHVLWRPWGFYPWLHWRHNDHDGVSNHQHHGCLLNRLFRRRSKKTSKLRVTSLCVGNSPGPVNSPHNGPVTRKMFPFDDVIMIFLCPLVIHLWSRGYCFQTWRLTTCTVKSLI